MTAHSEAAEVRTRSRATTRRKPRSRATSSSTVPLPSTSLTRVHSVMASGAGSPDITPFSEVAAPQGWLAPRAPGGERPRAGEGGGQGKAAGSGYEAAAR